MNSKYAPKTETQFLGYVVEECGEVLVAIGGVWGWGVTLGATAADSYERSLVNLRRELVDLNRAVFLLESYIYRRPDYQATLQIAKVLEVNPGYDSEEEEDGFYKLVAERCGRVLAAIGKSQRWGLDSFNPELPVDQRETNVSWVMRELVELKLSISWLDDHLEAVCGP